MYKIDLTVEFVNLVFDSGSPAASYEYIIHWKYDDFANWFFVLKRLCAPGLPKPPVLLYAKILVLYQDFRIAVQCTIYCNQ